MLRDFLYAFRSLRSSPAFAAAAIVTLALGIGASTAIFSVANAVLMGIQPADPLTFAAMAVLFFLIGALATWIPARHAAALDPSNALREE